ncbi:MAG: hypothetical protein WKF52_03520 [Sphingomicrobium sp.]
MKVVPDSYLAKTEAQQPEQVHPAQINFSNHGNNSVLKGASDTLDFAWNKLGAIRELRNQPNPEFTPAKHDRTVREAVDVFDREWGSRWDAAKAALKTELSRVEGQLERTANLRSNDKHFNSIVGTFQAMNPAERQEALGELIEQQDGPTLAALLEAPALVSGIKADQREAIKVQLFSRADPANYALRGQLDKALDKFEAASLAAIRYRQALREGTDRFDKRVAEAAERAAKATTGFAA